MNTLISELVPILQEFSNSNAEVTICGDFNMNLLRLDQYIKYDEFFELFLSQGFFPNITLPTRVTNTTATLIDQIYSKTYDNLQNSYSGILVSKISDHFPIFIFQKCQTFFKKQPDRILITKNGPRQIENFKSELNSYDWSSLFCDQASNNVKNAFDNFSLFYMIYMKNVCQQFQ